MRTALAALTLLALAAGPLHAQQPPDVKVLVQKMVQAMEPAKSCTRRIVLTVNSDGETVHFTAAQAHKVIDGRHRLLTVLLSPADQRGISSLILQGKPGQPDDRALWVPYVRRTRMLTPMGGYEAFMQSDFTYSDLGFVDESATWTVLGGGQKNGRNVWQLQAVPKDQWYYTKIVSFVDQATGLPVERDYYDPSGALWKVETFEDVTVIDGTPTATRIKMVDQQTKNSSELAVSALKYGVDLPDALFDPANLRKAIDSPVWPTTE